MRWLNDMQEQELLVDTSTSVFNAPRNPTGRKFLPVGHTALEIIKPNDLKDLNLPQSSVWVKNIYLSWYVPTALTTHHIPLTDTLPRTMHGGGLGRSTVALTERTAASPPLNATVVALDTLRHEWQTSEAYMKTTYDDRGIARPAKFCSNEEWYLKQGYEPMPGPEFLEWVYPETKEVERVPLIFFRKTVG